MLSPRTRLPPRPLLQLQQMSSPSPQQEGHQPKQRTCFVLSLTQKYLRVTCAPKNCTTAVLASETSPTMSIHVQPRLQYPTVQHATTKKQVPTRRHPSHQGQKLAAKITALHLPPRPVRVRHRPRIKLRHQLSVSGGSSTPMTTQLDTVMTKRKKPHPERRREQTRRKRSLSHWMQP